MNACIRDARALSTRITVDYYIYNTAAGVRTEAAVLFVVVSDDGTARCDRQQHTLSYLRSLRLVVALLSTQDTIYYGAPDWPVERAYPALH